MEERPWADQLRDLADAADHALAALRDVGAWAWQHVVASDVLPRQMPEPLGSHLTAVERNLSMVRELARALFGRLCSEPSGNLLAGRPLSREEYYLCRAMGVDFGGRRSLASSSLPITTCTRCSATRTIAVSRTSTYISHRAIRSRNGSWLGSRPAARGVPPPVPSSRAVGLSFEIGYPMFTGGSPMTDGRSSNTCVNLSVRPVTRVAGAPRAPFRPAGYAQRSASFQYSRRHRKERGDAYQPIHVAPT